MDSWLLQARRLLGPLRRQRGLASIIESETTLDRLVRSPSSGDAGARPLDATFHFILRVGRALLSFGLPAQRLEEALTRIAVALGLRIDCFAIPSALVATLSDGTHRRTRVVRLYPGDTDLERLCAVQGLVGRVERKELSPSEASRRLDAILSRPHRYRDSMLVLACGLASAASAILLGGGAGDILPALSLGTLVGALVRFAQRAPTFGRVLPALAAALTTVLARVFALAGASVHEPLLVLAAVIVLLPGFTLTLATLELATSNVVSGTARLVGALSALVQLGFGVAFGHRLAQLLPAVDVHPTPENAVWLIIAANGVAAFAFALLLRAAPRHIPSILLGAAVSVAGAHLGRAWLGPELGAFVGALLLGVVSHVYARLRDRPALLLLTPGILMLVPGSMGFLSISSMLQADAITALDTAFRMILVATSLAAGILVATLAVPPRRAL